MVNFTTQEKRFILVMLTVFLGGCIYQHIRDEHTLAMMRRWQQQHTTIIQQFFTDRDVAETAATEHPRLSVRTASAESRKAHLVSRIDLNSATIEELQSLERIGPVLAARIIEQREKTGGFKNVDELLSVKGIGEKTLARIREEICVRDK